MPSARRKPQTRSLTGCQTCWARTARYAVAPTFLMITGCEQVRSIAADIAGDREAAERVELDLPETGVCTRGGVEGGSAQSGCCGGPAAAEASACCADDASAKAAGRADCGCS